MVSRLTLEFLLLVISAHKLHVICLVKTEGLGRTKPTPRLIVIYYGVLLRIIFWFFTIQFFTILIVK